MVSAQGSITERDHALKVTKRHLRSLANADARDKEEVVEVDEFFANDDVIRFMQRLIEEKFKLSCTIGTAKTTCGFDIDAAVEVNKYRQKLYNAVNSMLRNKAASKKTTGYDYKFNVEGNQTQYTYDVEIEYKEAYCRDNAKTVIRNVISTADEVSQEIDKAMINTQVEYNPPFDVNDSFDDAMTTFLASE
jgi:hypothetical protein